MDEPGVSRAKPRTSLTAQATRPQPAKQSANRPRWTGYADTLPEEDDIAEAPAADSLEGLLEAEDEPEMKLPAEEDDSEPVEMATEDESETAAETEADADAEETEAVEK
jgi:hypothetical protein